MNPEQLKYAKSHEWVHVDAGSGTATVGISAFAVQALTDLVYMSLPEVGRKVKQGESFGEVESVKAVSDLYSPLDGEIVEVNSKLPDKLEWLSEDPYGKGWIIKLRVSNPAGLSGLMDHAAYQQMCEEQTE